MIAPAIFYPIENLLPWLERRVPLITPNRRLARHIKFAYAWHRHGAGAAAWETPRVMSLGQWWHACRRQIDPWHEHSQQLLDASQELELWVQCVRETAASETLLRPRAAARLARDAWHNLLLWRLDWRRGKTAAQFRHGLDTELFVQWAERFERLCRDKRLIVPATQIEALAGQCRQRQIVLLEFDELPPLQRHALNRQTDELVEYSTPGEVAPCFVHSCENTEEELWAAAHWAKQQLLHQPRARLGILLEDVAGQRLRFERILRETLQPEADVTAPLAANFSAGVTLDTTPLVRTALSLLALLCADIEVEALATLLHSRYRLTRERAAEAQMLRALYRNGRSLISNADLRWHGRKTGLGKILVELGQRKTLREALPPSAWSRQFSQCLTEMGWPGPGPLDSTEYQITEHWLDCLAGLGRLDPVCGPVSLDAALSLLRQRCADTLFQVQTADGQLQILGFLEAAGMQFDQVWIIGGGQNDWPAAASPNPFIPVSLQRSAAMPRADSCREHEFAGRILGRFKHSCAELHASYSNQADGVAQGPSPLLQDFVEGEVAVREQMPSRWKTAAGQARLIESVDSRAPAVTGAELATLRGGSSLIQDQSLCGFRAFVHQRLRVRALPELSYSLSAADRGNLLHEALNHLWRQIPNLQALRAGREHWPDFVAGAIAAALADLRWRGGRNDAVILGLEQQRLQVLLLKWLAVEAERQDFAVQAREEQCPVEIGPLQLELRIDRIDRLASGELLIIDYKSGPAEIRYWMGVRPTQPQLPLYACALQEHCAGVSFGLVRGDQPAFVGLAGSEQAAGIHTDIARASGALASDWPELLSHWRTVLEGLAQSFLDGEAAVDPPDTSASCTYCGLQPVCRIAERDFDGNA